MSILINLAAEFTGRQAFNQANKSILGLDKNAKKLAKTLGIAFSGAAVVAYAKASVKAFAADEAAAARLNTAIDNLGLSYSKVRANEFIASLEKTAGILDDTLRPAFQALLTTTGSLTKSQELLNNAIQISRASGIDLATVSQDLANGYIGITKGLKKYNTGLTQAELKSKSFNDVLGIMLAKSAGAAQAYLGTTAYKLDVLTVASENAKEKIGAGLVDAFARLGGGTEAKDAVKAIDNIAKAVNGITTAIGFAVGGLVKLYKGLDKITSLGGLTGTNGLLAGGGNKPVVNTNRSSSPAGTGLRMAQQRVAEAAAAKRAAQLKALSDKQAKAAKALAVSQAKATAEQKKQNALKKAGTIFDLEQIQIIAALKGKISDEDRKRLELQFALLTGNADEASRLTKELAIAQGLGIHLANYLASLPDAKNPFASWDAYLTALEERIKKLNVNPPVTIPQPANLPTTEYNSGTYVPSSGYVPPTNVGSIPQPENLPNTQYNQGTYVPSSGYVAPSITVTIDGKEIANALLNQSMSGNNAYLNRRIGGFD